MELDWMMLTNYAEDPGTGLLYMSGAGWDTIHVNGPVEGVPPGVVTVIPGTLALRLLFHQTELGTDRTFRIVIVDEDGGEVGKIEGGFRPEKVVGQPPGWPQGVNVVLPLAGLPLRKFGLHRVSLVVDEKHMGDREFRVIKHY